MFSCGIMEPITRLLRRDVRCISILKFTFILVLFVCSIMCLILPTKVLTYSYKRKAETGGNSIMTNRQYNGSNRNNSTITKRQYNDSSQNNESVDAILGKELSALTSYRIRNSNICSRNLTFVVVVHSAVTNFNKRRGIRQTWANPANYKAFTMKTVFFLGSTEDPELQSLVEEENAQFQDIVQGSFLDTYRNLTYKAVTVFKWVTEYCNEAELVIKVDDDVFVNMFKVFSSHLPLMKRKTNHLLCEVVKNGRIMRKSEKWALVSNELPAKKFYPTYCRGYFVLINPKLVKQLLTNIFLYPFFWIDDVYLFGMLAESSKVNFIDHTLSISNKTDTCAFSFITHDRMRGPSDCCVNVKDAQQMSHIWTLALSKNHGTYLQSIINKYVVKSWLSEN